MRLQRGAFLLEVFLWPTPWTVSPPAPCDRVGTSGCFCPFENKPGVSRVDASPVSPWFVSHKESVWKNCFGTEIVRARWVLMLVACSALSALPGFGQPEVSRSAFRRRRQHG